METTIVIWFSSSSTNEMKNRFWEIKFWVGDRPIIQTIELRLRKAHMAPPFKLRFTLRPSHVAIHLTAGAKSATQALRSTAPGTRGQSPNSFRIHYSQPCHIYNLPISTTAASDCSADIHVVDAKNEPALNDLPASRVSNSNSIGHIVISLRYLK